MLKDGNIPEDIIKEKFKELKKDSRVFPPSNP